MGAGHANAPSSNTRETKFEDDGKFVRKGLKSATTDVVDPFLPKQGWALAVDSVVDHGRG